MAVSIKIRESTKRRLERLKADLATKGGKDLSLQELLDAIVADAVQNPARVLAAAGGPRFPLPAEARRRLKERSFDFGVETSEEDIDLTLYSDDAVHGNNGLRAAARK